MGIQGSSRVVAGALLAAASAGCLWSSGEKRRAADPAHRSQSSPRDGQSRLVSVEPKLVTAWPASEKAFLEVLALTVPSPPRTRAAACALPQCHVRGTRQRTTLSPWTRRSTAPRTIYAIAADSGTAPHRGAASQTFGQATRQDGRHRPAAPRRHGRRRTKTRSMQSRRAGHWTCSRRSRWAAFSLPGRRAGAKARSGRASSSAWPRSSFHR